jgi:hypothetical protein
MAEPSKKSTEIELFLDDLLNLPHGGRVKKIEGNICVICGGSADSFTDELSKKEYSISGLCQKCQDRVFEEK